MARRVTAARVTAAESIIADHEAHASESVLYWERRAERIRSVSAMIAGDRITIGRRHLTVAELGRGDGAD